MIGQPRRRHATHRDQVLQEFTDNERSGIIRAVTDAIVSFTRENIRPHTWVVLEEIRSATGALAATRSGSRTSAPYKVPKPEPRPPLRLIRSWGTPSQAAQRQRAARLLHHAVALGIGDLGCGNCWRIGTTRHCVAGSHRVPGPRRNKRRPMAIPITMPTPVEASVIDRRKP